MKHAHIVEKRCRARAVVGVHASLKGNQGHLHVDVLDSFGGGRVSRSHGASIKGVGTTLLKDAHLSRAGSAYFVAFLAGWRVVFFIEFVHR